MLIKSLKMQNFRQFKGITAVDFSCDPEQNVTIIWVITLLVKLPFCRRLTGVSMKQLRSITTPISF